MKNDVTKRKNNLTDLSLVYNAPMFVYVQRQGEKPFSLNALMLRISAGNIIFKCRSKLKLGEIVGVIFKIAKRDIMANIRVVTVKKGISGLRSEYMGIFIGLSNEQDQYIRRFVLSENLRLNKIKRMQKKHNLISNIKD